jgi:hypothetical protein
MTIGRTLAAPAAALAAAVGLFAGAFAAPAFAVDTGDKEPIYDFNNAFYSANGVRPGRLQGRRDGRDGLSVIDRRLHPNQRNVRVTLTAPAYDEGGELIFFAPVAVFAEDGFTANNAGREARNIARSFPLYEFPRAANAPGEVFPKRQASLVDLRGGYFSNDPLGLWILTFVSYTDRALTTPAGLAALAELGTRNGYDVDGTPIIKTVDEIESLEEDGFVSVTELPRDGSLGPQYFVCPVYKDPREGAIAPDAFLDMVRDANGNVLPDEAFMEDEFACLQETGDNC